MYTQISVLVAISTLDLPRSTAVTACTIHTAIINRINNMKANKGLSNLINGRKSASAVIDANMNLLSIIEYRTVPNTGPLNSISTPDASSGSASPKSKGILPEATYDDIAKRIRAGIYETFILVVI